MRYLRQALLAVQRSGGAVPEECKTINCRQKQLAYYHRKQSGQKAGEAI